MADTRQDGQARAMIAVLFILGFILLFIHIHDQSTIHSLRQQLSQQQATKYEYPTFLCPRSASCIASDAVAFGNKGLFAYHVKEGRWLDQFGYVLTESDVHIAVDGNEAKKPASVR